LTDSLFDRVGPALGPRIRQLLAHVGLQHVGARRDHAAGVGHRVDRRGGLYLAALTTAVVVLAMRVGERDEDTVDDRQAFSASRLTIPVSIVVPVAAGARWADVAATIDALLGLNYPAFEVIVVADDLPHGAWDPTKAVWRLEAREIFFRAWLDAAPIRMMYRSARDPRLIVVHKTPGSSADALNCGVNLAKFRYLCEVEPGITVRRRCAAARDDGAARRSGRRGGCDQSR
jgi:hypothetical protein